MNTYDPNSPYGKAGPVTAEVKTPVTEDSGGWAYRMFDDGRIEIVSAPTGKKLKAGDILDPRKIEAIQDPVQRQKAGTAYASILSKVKTGQSIPEMQAKLSGGKKTPAGGATPAPAAASAAPPDTLRMQNPPEDAPGPGISTVSPPPAAEIPKPGLAPGPRPRTTAFLNSLR